jgi:ribosome-associated protein
MTLDSSSLPVSVPTHSNLNSLNSSQDLALTIARAAADRKGGDILLLDVGDISYLAEYFVIVTGFSKPQVRAIAQGIQAATAQEYQRSPRHSEGLSDSSWIVLDYGEVIVHIQLPREREFYSLEAFWGHAEAIDFLPEQATHG